MWRRARIELDGDCDPYLCRKRFTGRCGDSDLGTYADGRS
jgi:hypothetical protein